MADKLTYNSEDLQQCITRYNSALSTLKDAYSSYTKSLQDLKNDWTGKAFAIMCAKVTAMGVNIAKSFDKLTDATSELSEIQGIMSETETAQKTKIASQDEGTQSPFTEG